MRDPAPQLRSTQQHQQTIQSKLQSPKTRTIDKSAHSRIVQDHDHTHVAVPAHEYYDAQT